MLIAPFFFFYFHFHFHTGCFDSFDLKLIINICVCAEFGDERDVGGRCLLDGPPHHLREISKGGRWQVDEMDIIIESVASI